MNDSEIRTTQLAEELKALSTQPGWKTLVNLLGLRRVDYAMQAVYAPETERTALVAMVKAIDELTGLVTAWIEAGEAIVIDEAAEHAANQKAGTLSPDERRSFQALVGGDLGASPFDA